MAGIDFTVVAYIAIFVFLIVIVVLTLGHRTDGLAFLLEALLERKDDTPGGGTGAATGKEALVGRRAEVVSSFEATQGHFEGWVSVGGERWRARTRSVPGPGDAVTIDAIEGLVLEVSLVDGSD